MEHVELTPAQEEAWVKTRSALMWQCPAFSHLFYNMLNNGKSKHIAIFTSEVPIAATDGSNLLLNPETFFKYKLKERVFIVAHEIMHCVLNHMVVIHRAQRAGKITYPDGKELPYVHDLMNIALDLVINDGLIESGIGQFNSDWLHDTSIATHADSGVEVYRKIYEEAQKNGGGGGGGSGQGGKGFDQHLKPGTSQGKDPAQAAQDRSDAQWKAAVAGAAESARVQGKLPAALDRMFGDILEPQVDWTDHIETLFAIKIGNQAYSWRKIDRRLITRGAAGLGQEIVGPGRVGFGADTIAVAVDTSGSIGNKEVDMFMAEMAGILEDVRPEKILILWCDAKLQRVDEAEDVDDLLRLRHKGAPGGGGTAFGPVFKYLFEEGITPDCLVYLTDGMGSFPDTAPSYPVIWGSIYENASYPWGDVVQIPKQNA